MCSARTSEPSCWPILVALDGGKGFRFRASNAIAKVQQIRHPCLVSTARTANKTWSWVDCCTTQATPYSSPQCSQASSDRRVFNLTSTASPSLLQGVCWKSTSALESLCLTAASPLPALRRSSKRASQTSCTVHLTPEKAYDTVTDQTQRHLACLTATLICLALI